MRGVRGVNAVGYLASSRRIHIPLLSDTHYAGSPDTHPGPALPRAAAGIGLGVLQVGFTKRRRPRYHQSTCSTSHIRPPLKSAWSTKNGSARTEV